MTTQSAAQPTATITGDFEDDFVVIPDQHGEQVRHGVPVNVHETHLWTIVEADDGDLYAVPGLHWVDRLGYLVTGKPWPNEDVEVLWVHYPRCGVCGEEVDEGATGLVHQDPEITSHTALPESIDIIRTGHAQG